MQNNQSNLHTAKLQFLIKAYAHEVSDVAYKLGQDSGNNDNGGILDELKEAKRAMNNEIAALNIEMIRLKMRNADLQGFVENCVKAWEDSDDVDMYMFSAAVKLATTKGDNHE